MQTFDRYGRSVQVGSNVLFVHKSELRVFLYRANSVFSNAQELLNDRYYEVGRTETIMNDLNPKFAHRFMLDYFFEERQMLRFELWVFYQFKKAEHVNVFADMTSTRIAHN
jgi:hypothetical protein